MDANRMIRNLKDSVNSIHLFVCVYIFYEFKIIAAKLYILNYYLSMHFFLFWNSLILCLNKNFVSFTK